MPAVFRRCLPIAADWSDVPDAAAKNTALRHQVNKPPLGDGERGQLSSFISSCCGAPARSRMTLPAIRSANSYGAALQKPSADQPFKIADRKKPDADGVAAVVQKII